MAGLFAVAGVIQEIDLQIARQAVERATQDAESAGKRIGQATTQGTSAELQKSANLFDQIYGKQATRAGSNAGQDFTAALTRTFKLAEADTREALARGLITPAQARVRGQEAARAYNVGILNEVQRLGTSGALAGRAGQDQFIGLAGSLKSVTAEGEKAHKGLNTVRSGLVQLAAQATNTTGPIGTVANGLLTFAGGGTAVLAIVAGLAIIAKGIELIGKKSREAAAEAKKFFEGLDAAIEARARKEDPGKAFFGDFEKIARDYEATLDRLAKARAGRTVREKGELVHLSPDPEEIARIEADLEKIRARAVEVGKQINEALASKEDTSAPAGRSATSRVASVREVLRLENEIAKSEAYARKAADDWWKEERGRVQQQEEDEAAHQQQLAENRASLAADLQHQLVGLTTTTVDDLELQLHDLQVKIIETFGSVPAEYQPLLDDLRNKIKAAKEDTAGLSAPVEDLGTNWEKVAETVATVAQGILDMARGLGIASEQMEKVAQGAISLAKNLPSALTGDPASIIGAVGGVVSIVGGIFGGPDREPARRDENQQLYEAALKGDEAALNRLLMKSGPVAQGGWHSANARTDALNKYNSAKSHLAEQSTEYARQEALRAAQGQEGAAGELRERQMGSEEAQVAARAESERRSRINTLLASGGPGDLVKRLKDLEAEFEDLVKRSPLGEDSPLARDSKRRADDAARDLERAIDDAKSETERQAKEALRAQGKDITPGFTVQRTLTESSAGRIVGELTSQTVWLERIYRQLGGREGVAGAAVGGAQTVQLVCDGRVLAEVVTPYMASDMQNHQALNGNAAMST